MLCEGAQYDSCVNSPCQWASCDGRRRPQHPKNRRATEDKEEAGERFSAAYPRACRCTGVSLTSRKDIVVLSRLL
jgi:hypothetical protein